MPNPSKQYNIQTQNIIKILQKSKLYIKMKSTNTQILKFMSIITFLLLLTCIYAHNNKRTLLSADNICTFHIADRLFSLIYLQSNNPYRIDINGEEKILFNFCHSFIPDQCKNNGSGTNSSEPANTNQTSQQLDSFAFHIKKYVQQVTNQTTNTSTSITKYTCQRYTSNSYIYYFNTDYVKHNDEPQLILNMTTADKSKAAEFHIYCSGQDYFKINSYLFSNNKSKLIINGQSSYGCPVFQISSLWTTLEDNRLILGIILFVLGFQLLFYGLLMINVTVFIAGYFISFAILGGIFTVFLGPGSSSIAVYFSLLFILLSSTLIAYGLTKLINLSIFFIGAFFGLIVGALVNTLFNSIIAVHNVWSLVIFQVLFTIPFGLLTFKYSDEVIIMSTSLTGSYLIIRPISWILGGFPNQFTLYQMFESQQISSIPWGFYLYLILILILAIMGGFYQFLKLQRLDPHGTITTNIVTQSIEQPLDKIKNTVDKLIARYSSSNDGQERYKKMKQLQYQNQYLENSFPANTQYGLIDGKRNSKQRISQQRLSKQRTSQQRYQKQRNSAENKQSKDKKTKDLNNKDEQFF